METTTEAAVVETAQREHPESAELTAVLSGAVDAARAAVVEFSGNTVGEYLGVSFEDTNAATHRFLAELPGYQGWQWAVVVAAYPGATQATISEVVLVPGATALLAPAWVPWEQRIQPGDLSPGDLLAPPADDPRLVPGFTLSGDPDVDETAAEIGLGRKRVLSAWGRADAAQRWHDGDYGPDSAMARSTKRVCRDCGYFLPLAGSLGVMFGVCANEFAADGRVVDFTYGCGAHSDTPAPHGAGSPLYDPYDDGVLEVSETPVPQPATASETETEPDPVPIVVSDVIEFEVPVAEGLAAEAVDSEPTVVTFEPEAEGAMVAEAEATPIAESAPTDELAELPAPDAEPDAQTQPAPTADPAD
jgi:hypothetical protein